MTFPAPTRPAAGLPGPVRGPVRAQPGDVVRRPPAERPQDRGTHPAAARGGAARHRAAVQGAPVPVQHARGRLAPLAPPFRLGEAAALPPQVNVFVFGGATQYEFLYTGHYTDLSPTQEPLPHPHVLPTGKPLPPGTNL